MPAPNGFTHTLLVIVCLIGFIQHTIAQAPPTKQVLQTQLTKEVIRIDGLLDETAWETVLPATDFTQVEPIENAPPSFKSEVKILYSESAIYVSAILYDNEPSKIFKPLGRRDEQLTTDQFSFALDSAFDRKTAFIFSVNPANVQRDGVFAEGTGGGGGGNRSDMDSSWDAVWDSATRIIEKGWVVEMRIPYAMLRFSNQAKQTWGINFRRTIGRLGEVHSWVYIPRTERSIIANYGHLVGIENIKPKRNIQITPYTLGQFSHYKEDGVVHKTPVSKIGTDVKVGITSNTILDLTINPDYGQVDADPAELNLTAFETVLQEKRPFFTEGAQIFDFIFGGQEGGMLYTRRIGELAPIISAAKITGRTAQGLSFGTLGAITGEDFSPYQVFSASRIKKELGAYSKIGSGVTFYNQTDNLRNSVVGGIDWDIRNKTNTYQINGHGTFTHVQLPMDGTKETGYFGAMRVFKIQGVTQFGSGLEVYSPLADPSDVGRLRDRDFIEWFGNFRRFLHNNKPFGPVQRGQVNTFFWNRWSYSQPVWLGFGWFMNSNFQLKSYRRISIGSNVDEIGGYNIRETRDLGEAVKLPSMYNFSLNGASDARKHYLIEPNFRLGLQEGGGRSYRGNLEFSWTVSSNWALEAEFTYMRTKNVLSWITNQTFKKINENTWGIQTNDYVGDEKDFPPTAFTPMLNTHLMSVFGNRKPMERAPDLYYNALFGERDSITDELSLRSNFTFTPNISLQLYAQIYVTKGQYNNLKLIQDKDHLVAFPGTYPKRHDFRYSNFQSNTVFRWEYRPGSTLYVVWSHARGDERFETSFPGQTPSPYEDSTKDLLHNTFSAFPSQGIILKINYLLMR